MDNLYNVEYLLKWYYVVSFENTFWEVKDKMKNETLGSFLKDWIQVCFLGHISGKYHGQKPPLN